MPAVRLDRSANSTKSRKSISKISQPTKPSLSEEFVRDSDEADEAPVELVRKSPPPKTKKLKKPSSSLTHSKPTAIASTASSGKRRSPSSSSSGSSDGAPAGKRARLEETPSTNASDTSENHDTQGVHHKLIRNGVLATEGVKGRTDSIGNAQEGKPLRNGRSTKSTTESSSASSDESGLEDSSQDEQERETHKLRKSASQAEDDEQGNRNPVFERPRIEFNPPSGYLHTTISFPPASAISNILKPSNLQGKQMWHISAPVQAPVHLIQELPLESLEDESIIASDNGEGFCFTSENTDPTECIATLLPSDDNNVYQVLQSPEIRRYKIRRRLILPSHVIERSVSAKVGEENLAPATTSRIQQPENLKMRFHPFGVSSDSETDPAPIPDSIAPSNRRSSPTKTQSSHKKRKHSKDATEISAAESSPRKGKKLKVAHLEESVLARAPDRVGLHEQAIEKSSKSTPSKTERVTVVPETPSLMQSRSNKRGETPKDRADRKEEKRRRKALEAGSARPSSQILSAVQAPQMQNSQDLKSPSKSSKLRLEPSTKPGLSLSDFSARLTAEEDGERHRHKHKHKSHKKVPTSEPETTDHLITKEDTAANGITSATEGPTGEIRPVTSRSSFHTAPFPPPKITGSSTVMDKRSEGGETAEAKAERKRRRKEEKKMKKLKDAS